MRLRLFSLLAAGFCCVAPPTADVFSLFHGFAESSIFSVYNLGDLVTFSDKEIETSAGKTTVSAILTYPSGISKGGPKFQLTETGKYYLSYQAFKGESSVTENHEFLVCDNLVDFASKSSRAEIVNDGIRLSFPGETKSYFATVLDFSSLEPDEPVLKLRIDPSKKGNSDFSKLRFDFSDLYDQTNSMSILVQASPYSSSTAYALASGKGQQLTGYEAEHDRIHVNNQFGAPFGFSFSGNEGFEQLSLSFSSETLTPYVGPKSPIVCLKSKDYFKNIWNGFSQGKARLSITPLSFLSSEGSIVIQSLKGAVLNSLKDYDVESPDILVDYLGNDKPPYALINHPYPLFHAEGNDIRSGFSPIKQEVFFDYNKTSQITIDSFGDSFVPTKEGIYTIQYSCFDSFGNKAIENIQVIAKKTVPPVSLNILSSGRKTEAKVGEDVIISKAIANGGTGKLRISSNVYLEGKLVSENASSFIPLKEGTYDVSYQVRDYINQVSEASYNIEVSKSSGPVFSKKPLLPKVLLEGESYQLPELEAIDYSGTTPQIVKAKPYFFNGEQLLETINGALPISTDLDVGTIRYIAESSSIDFELPVVHANSEDGIHMEKYFFGANATAFQDSVLLSLSKETIFANSLLSVGMNLKFSYDPSSEAAQSIFVQMSDIIEPEKKITLEILPSGVGSLCKFSDNTIALRSGFLNESPNNDYSFSLSGKTMLINGEIKTNISLFDDGSSFDGFPSSRINLSFFAESGDNSRIFVKNINGQQLNSNKVDGIKPRIAIIGDYGGDKSINSVGLAAKALALDVLDPNVKASLTVTKPDHKSLAVSTDGTKLDCVSCNNDSNFLLDEYGSWKVDYQAFDSHNSNVIHSIYSYRVCDEIKPNLEVSVPSISLREGETCLIPSFEVSDNYTSKENISVSVYLIDSQGSFTLIGEQGIKGLTKGNYFMRFLAYDEAGNLCIKEIQVEVSK